MERDGYIHLDPPKIPFKEGPLGKVLTYARAVRSLPHTRASELVDPASNAVMLIAIFVVAVTAFHFDPNGAVSLACAIDGFDRLLIPTGLQATLHEKELLPEGTVRQHALLVQSGF